MVKNKVIKLKITSDEVEIIAVTHGTASTYKRMGCRCEICVTWAISSGFVKRSRSLK